ncbi:hypothetical protein [Roseivirga spongicola]|uniref:hypothetical protein n=1 Tax=Roseivirga spongicola TaxID=333140 RepID=UPI002AC8FB83|nr:hypothetical protein [Roseivirga spongicola]WPZ08739.1 hypothetical protein T7867_10765 [Roseivirga spongicola]
MNDLQKFRNGLASVYCDLPEEGFNKFLEKVYSMEGSFKLDTAWTTPYTSGDCYEIPDRSNRIQRTNSGRFTPLPMSHILNQDTEWKPQRGERVLVRDSEATGWRERIFLCEIEGSESPYTTVKKAYEAEFEKKEMFEHSCYEQMKPLNQTPLIEVTISEIAKLKGVKPEQIRIKK